MSENKIHFAKTGYGFEYGAAKIERIHSDEQDGSVFLRVETEKEILQIRVTRTGLIRTSQWKKGKEK